MSLFDTVVAFVLDREKEWSDNGTTRWGIQAKSYPNVDLAAMTKEKAVEFYRAEFWQKLRCDELPPAVAALFFDGAINHGPFLCVKLLQASVGVPVDGVIGPLTIARVNSINVDTVVPELVARRMLTYGLAHNFDIEGLGWSRRLAAIHQLSMQVQKENS